MNYIGIVLFIFGKCCCLSLLVESSNRSFIVDWDNDGFLKDGENFRFIAGSFHYFRAHPDSWQRKLRTMRAAGLNAITTYVEWSLHNPKEGIFVWNGIADIERFLQLAFKEDLLVILRPGPYICAERDFGGFPYWLLTKHPKMRPRTSDIDYLMEVRNWYRHLMPIIQPYLYGNGGPIIMVQVENEYGSFYACDIKYRMWLRDETQLYVKDNAVLFTNDGPNVIACGHIPGVLATLDFGATNNLGDNWRKLRQIQPHGPLVNIEFYPGWLTHWGERMANVTFDYIKNTFIQMLLANASVNFYMFYGGTNFGFTSGANDGGPGKYQADITSYDYDAPMNEAGDPTSKYFALRLIIGNYLPVPEVPVPKPITKKKYGIVQLEACCSILSELGRHYLSTGVVRAEKPLTFEALNQNAGLVLYETFLPNLKNDPSKLQIQGLHDRAYVYINHRYMGILSREIPITELFIPANAGHKLQILVENQGRINFGSVIDFKGIISDVKVGKKVLQYWNMTKFPLESYDDIMHLIERKKINNNTTSRFLIKGPKIFHGTLDISNDQTETFDTYVDTTGWGKGIIFINGENMGRYWPLVGPQITLYIPREVLKIGINHIVLIEYQQASPTGQITFTDEPNLNGGAL